MIKYIFLLVVFCALNISGFAQVGIQWSKCYGSDSGSTSGYFIINTSDGGFLTTGVAQADGNDVSGIHNYSVDGWVVKIDSLGNIIWQKCLGGSAGESAIAAVEVDGGYVIACESGSSDGDVTRNQGYSDFWIVKLNYTGSIIWEKSYGAYLQEHISDIAASPDGGIILVGAVRSLDSGDVSGHHGGSGADDMWLVKLDSLGNLIWQKCLGGTHQEILGQVECDPFGNIYVVCGTNSVDGDVTCFADSRNVWLTKLDSNANILWDRCYGGINTAYGQSIYSMQIIDRRILMSGWASSNDGDLNHNYGYSDAWILLTDTSGNIIFSESYGGSRSDEFFSARMVSDNYIVAGGWTNSSDHDIHNNSFPSATECWLVAVDTLGNLLWENTYGGSGGERLNSLCVQNNKIVFTGWTISPNSGDVSGRHSSVGDEWVVCLDLLTQISENNNKHDYTVYPQPFSSDFHLNYIDKVFQFSDCHIEMFDINGSLIPIQKIVSDHSIQIKPDKSISSGIYFIRVLSELTVSNIKMIKM
jgi:hypothetical protein